MDRGVRDERRALGGKAVTPKCPVCKRDQDDCVCAYRLNPVVIDQIVRQQEEIEDLRQQLEESRKSVKKLREAIAGLMPWVVTQVVACNGLKCRELVCESCSCDAEENAQKACDSYSLANEALADTASEDQAK